MIVRRDGLVVSQLAHSALAGRLAEAWALDPALAADDLRVAATIHDLGWAPWELAPTLNPETGRPHAFYEVPDPTYLDIWARGTDQAMAFGRLVGALVSRHCTRLLSRRPGEGAAALVARERARQERLGDWPGLTEMSDLIATWDGISLDLCHGREVDLDPWPFATGRVVVTADARDLGPGTFATQAELDAALAAAPWRELRWELSPGAASASSA